MQKQIYFLNLFEILIYHELKFNTILFFKNIEIDVPPVLGTWTNNHLSDFNNPNIIYLQNQNIF